MKALLHYGGQRFSVQEVPDPAFVPGKVLVRVEACGVCGGEISAYKAGANAPEASFPAIPGHEMAGVVLRSDCAALPEGTPVAVSPNAGCGVCAHCRGGYAHLCLGRRPRTPDIGGGYAQMALVERHQCYPILSGLPFDIASLAEPLACVLHSAARVRLAVGERVLILGGGAGAQLFVAVARLMGASCIVLADDKPERLALARLMGADAVLPGYDASPADADIRLMAGADVVINTRSAPEFTGKAVSFCAAGGRVLCYGVAGPALYAQVPPHDLWRKEISLVGSRSFAGEFEAALRLLEAGRLDAARIVTRRVPLEGAAEALATPSEAIKTVILPW